MLRLLLALPLLLVSCAQLRSPGVLLATDPPGAKVLLNGRESGAVTPVYMDLDRDPYRIDFVLPDYETATRFVDSGGSRYLVLWKEASLSPGVWHFPLFLTVEDFLLPIKSEKISTPQRIFVRMRIAGE